ncbi:MAG: hypothetical protein R8M45_04930 [Ghiorsea sp.]
MNHQGNTPTQRAKVSSYVALELLKIQIKAMRPQEGACSLMDAMPNRPVSPESAAAYKILQPQL